MIPKDNRDPFTDSSYFKDREIFALSEMLKEAERERDAAVLRADGAEKALREIGNVVGGPVTNYDLANQNFERGQLLKKAADIVIKALKK